MANRPKVDFLINVPLTVKLGDNFKNGTGQYGPWFGWGVYEGPVEKTLFADQQLNDLIKGYPKGTDLAITKQQIGPKQFAWFVMPAGIQAPPGVQAPPVAPPVAQNGHSGASEAIKTWDRASYRGERVSRAKEAILDALESIGVDSIDENVRALAISFLIDEQRRGIAPPEEEGAAF